MKKLLLVLSVLFSLLVLNPTGVWAATATLNPTDDTFVSSYYPSYPSGNFGSSSTIYIGNTPSTGAIRHVLVKYSLSSIPSGSTINSATLRLYRSGGTGTGPFSIGLWRLTSNWSESTVTWGSKPSEVTTGVFSSIDSTVGYKTWAVTDIVKNWKSGAYANYGLRVGFTGSSSDWSIAFNSKETGSNKPELAVDYTAPDTQAPTISSLAVSEVTQTGAKITWNTNENSDSWVDYGTAVSYGSTSGQNDSVTSHAVTLGGLTANTTYHYRVRSKDGSGNQATSGDGTFTTASVVTPPTSSTPPTTTTQPPASGGTDAQQPSSSTTTGTTGTGQTGLPQTTTSTPSAVSTEKEEAVKPVKFEGNKITGFMGGVIALLLLLVVVLGVAILKKQPVMQSEKKEEEPKKEEPKEEVNKEVKEEQEKKITEEKVEEKTEEEESTKE